MIGQTGAFQPIAARPESPLLCGETQSVVLPGKRRCHVFRKGPHLRRALSMRWIDKVNGQGTARPLRHQALYLA